MQSRLLRDKRNQSRTHPSLHLPNEELDHHVHSERGGSINGGLPQDEAHGSGFGIDGVPPIWDNQGADDAGYPEKGRSQDSLADHPSIRARDGVLISVVMEMLWITVAQVEAGNKRSSRICLWMSLALTSSDMQ